MQCSINSVDSVDDTSGTIRAKKNESFKKGI